MSQFVLSSVNETEARRLGSEGAASTAQPEGVVAAKARVPQGRAGVVAAGECLGVGDALLCAVIDDGDACLKGSGVVWAVVWLHSGWKEMTQAAV